MDAYNVYVARRELYLIRLTIEDFSSELQFYNYSRIVYSAIVREAPAVIENVLWQQALSRLQGLCSGTPYTSRELLKYKVVERLSYYSSLIEANVHIDAFQTPALEETGLAHRVY